MNAFILDFLESAVANMGQHIYCMVRRSFLASSLVEAHGGCPKAWGMKIFYR